MDFVKQLWRGDVPLFKTYWVFGFAVSILLNAIMMFVVALQGEMPSLEPLFLGLWVFTTLYGLFMAVAIWRSAGKYEGPKHWGLLARAVVVLSVLRTVLNITGVS